MPERGQVNHLQNYCVVVGENRTNLQLPVSFIDAIETTHKILSESHEQIMKSFTHLLTLHCRKMTKLSSSAYMSSLLHLESLSDVR